MTCNGMGKKVLLPVVADVMERVGANPLPPAAPKYPAASVIQPELKWVPQLHVGVTVALIVGQNCCQFV